MADKPPILNRIAEFLDTWQWTHFVKNTFKRSLPQLDKSTEIVGQSTKTIGLAVPQAEKHIKDLAELLRVIREANLISYQELDQLQEHLGNLSELGVEAQEHVTAHLATFAINLPEWLRRDRGLWHYMLEEVDIPVALDPALEKVELERLEMLYQSFYRVYEIRKSIQDNDE